PAQSVHNREVTDSETLASFGRQLLKFLQGHALIGFVVEIKRTPATAIVANDTIENDDGSVFWPFYSRHYVLRHNALANQLHHRRIAPTSAAADRREQRDFVAGVQRRVRTGVFLIHGNRD